MKTLCQKGDAGVMLLSRDGYGKLKETGDRETRGQGYKQTEMLPHCLYCLPVPQSPCLFVPLSPSLPLLLHLTFAAGEARGVRLVV